MIQFNGHTCFVKKEKSQIHATKAVKKALHWMDLKMLFFNAFALLFRVRLK